MRAQSPTVQDLLAIAGRMRVFAREATSERYGDRFRRGATDLELEALGHAASHAVADAIRAVRRERTRESRC
jgi:hypothetical protein